MSFQKDNAAAQTANQHTLLDNGYTPLANIDKRCMLKGWSTLSVTHEYIEENWEGRRAYQATGIRLEDGVCAIDVDIDDVALVAAIWKAAVKAVPALKDALIRWGKGHKEMWLVRVDKTFGVAYSKAFNDPEDESETSQRVEIFGGDHPRQFGVLGVHTMGDDGEPEVEYEWDGGTPLRVPRDELPVISQADVTKIIEIANDILTRSDWPEAEGWGTGMSTGETVYDLTEDMRFECEDDETRNLQELADWAAAGGKCRCSASWLDGQRHYNKTRCLVSITHDDHVSVLEMGNWERHMAAEAARDDDTTSEAFEALSDGLEAAGFDLDEAYADAPDSFRDRVNYLLENWAYCADRVRCALPITRDEERSCTLAGLRGSEARHSYTQVGPRGGEKRINPADAWYNHAQRLDATGYRFMPERSMGLHDVEGELVINSYAPIIRPAVTKDRARYVRIWYQFLEHLFPNEAEREWILDWMAHKLRHPEVPAVAILMTTRTQGTGRGTLFEIMQKLFGDQYCRTVPSSLLTGSDGQAAYTDYMARTLVVFADEVLPDGDAGSSMEWKRKKTYERLKERMDPKPHWVTIVRKGLPNYREMVSASFVMASNHPNAVPVGEQDRRVVVMTNTEVKLMDNAEVYDAINTVRDPQVDMEFITAIHDELMLRDISEFSPYLAPAFEGRRAMIEANKSELDEIVDQVLRDMPHDIATTAGLRDRVRVELRNADLEHEFKGWRAHCVDYAGTVWRVVHTRKAYGLQKSRAQFIVRDTAAEAALEDMAFVDREFYVREAKDFNIVASAEKLAERLGMKVVK